MHRMGHQTLVALKNDPSYSRGIFQRLNISGQNKSTKPDSVVALYQTQIAFDLTSTVNFITIQEIMIHRHLYAHNSGLIDEAYLQDVKRITGNDLLNYSYISQNYPNYDVYWFEPL